MDKIKNNAYNIARRNYDMAMTQADNAMLNGDDITSVMWRESADKFLTIMIYIRSN